MPPAVHRKHDGSKGESDKAHDYSGLYKQFGVGLSVNGSAEAVADACPWCHKDRCYFNIETAY